MRHLAARRYCISVNGAAGQWVAWEYATTLTECLERVEEALTLHENVQVEIIHLWPDEQAADVQSRAAS